MKAQAQLVARSKLAMRKPYQRSSVAGPVKQQRRRLAAELAGNWTSCPSPPVLPAPAGNIVTTHVLVPARLARSGSKSFSDAEDELLVKLHALLGNRWSLIAGRLPGRTGKEVESHWNSKMKTKLKRVGVDPGNRRSTRTLLAPAADDERQRRWRALESCEAECPATAKHPNLQLPASDDCVSDAGSDCRAQRELASGLNLELTLSTPCLYYGGKEQVADH